MKTLLWLVNALTLLAWPLLIWLLFAQPQWHFLCYLLALTFALRGWMLRRSPQRYAQVFGLMAWLGALLCLSAGMLRTFNLLLWYPVMVNLTLLLLFGRSLWRGMPLVERLARLREPQLPPQGVRYTRRVTQVWCGFFILNGGIALFTCLHGDQQLWTLWNAGLSYLMMALLMGGEWCVRQRIRRSA